MLLGTAHVVRRCGLPFGSRGQETTQSRHLRESSWRPAGPGYDAVVVRRRDEVSLAWSTALAGALVGVVAAAVTAAVAVDRARVQDFADGRDVCVSSLLSLGEIVQRTELALQRAGLPPVFRDQPAPYEIREAIAQVQFPADRVTAFCHGDGLIPINSVTALWGRTLETSLHLNLVIFREPDGQLSAANKSALDALRDWAYTTATLVGELDPAPMLPWQEAAVPEGFEDGSRLAPTSVIPKD